MPKYMSIEERFYQKVEKTDSCWLWTGARNSRGYGCFSDGTGKRLLAHRYSYTLHRDVIPEGLIVCHTCDVRECVNPEHLWVGTHKDNSDDMFAKNRQGSSNRPSLFCKRGHEFASVGVREQVMADGTVGRSCLECKKIRDKERNEDPAERERRRQYNAEYYKKYRETLLANGRAKYAAGKQPD